DDVLNIGLNRAVTLIADKVAKGPRKGRFGADPGRALGDHPQKGGPIVVKNGRYGPYVSHNGVNATLPRDKAPEEITLDEAVTLLDARAARTGDAPTKRRAPTRKTAAPKRGTPASAEPAAKKPAKKRAVASGAKIARKTTAAE